MTATARKVVFLHEADRQYVRTYAFEHNITHSEVIRQALVLHREQTIKEPPRGDHTT